MVAAILAVIISASVVITISDDDGPGPHRGGTITVGTANNKTIVATAESVEQAAGAHAETGLAGDGNAATQRSSDQANPDAPVVAGPVPAASPYQRGCLTRSNTTNFSYRNGTKPSIIPLHLTVAPNYVGWGDINGVAVFLNRSATQASANYIVDNEGHCIYTVAEVFKAWTQANYNSASACSFEVQNTGNEVTYAASRGLDKLALVVHDCAKRWHIPLQRAVVSNGRVLKAGVIDHLHLYAAGGGHVDILHFGDGCTNRGASASTWACVDLVIAKARALDRKPITAGQRKRCRELDGLRHKAGQPHTTLSAKERARGKAIKTGLRAHRLRCLPGGNLKRA